MADESKTVRVPAEDKKDWKIFQGDGREPHTALKGLPLPPWRNSKRIQRITKPDLDKDRLDSEKDKAAPFLPDQSMVLAVNAALYLRRPLLITGRPGTGKSTLISKVAHELQLGPVLRWNITSRTTVRSGIYEYDAVGRLHKYASVKATGEGSKGTRTSGPAEPPIEDYLSLGPLGTAMLGQSWPRALLIDEIDKGDLDLANDLLNVIEEGTYDIPELRRLGSQPILLTDGFKRRVPISGGQLECQQFPFVVMTSNGEREFPPPFLRRCVRLSVTPPNDVELGKIVARQLENHLSTRDSANVEILVKKFYADSKTDELATDQLLNAVFLTIGMNDGSSRAFTETEVESLRSMLLNKLN